MNSEVPKEAQPQEFLGENFVIKRGFELIRWRDGSISLSYTRKESATGNGHSIAVRLDRSAQRRLLLTLEGVDRESLDSDEPLPEDAR